MESADAHADRASGHMSLASDSLDSATREECPAQQLPTVRIRNVRFHAISEAQCIRHILNEIDHGRGGWVVTPNLDILRRCEQEAEVGRLVGCADVVVADGMPLIWASRLQGSALPERVAGSNLIHSLTAAAAEAERSIFLLGGDPGTAEDAASVLQSRNPELVVAGHACPPVGFGADVDYMAELTTRLVEAGPDIVYVALGCPKQERLIERLRPHLPNAWWLGIGISFSFVSGDVRRAPVWMQRAGLEWIHRLCQEPRRLARRYLLEGLPFALRLLGGAVLARGRLSGRGNPGKRDADLP